MLPTMASSHHVMSHELCCWQQCKNLSCPKLPNICFELLWHWNVGQWTLHCCMLGHPLCHSGTKAALQSSRRGSLSCPPPILLGVPLGPRANHGQMPPNPWPRHAVEVPCRSGLRCDHAVVASEPLSPSRRRGPWARHVATVSQQ